MNIKIKATDVNCFVPGDYGQVYQTLQKHLKSPLKDLFAERTEGHEYLQWELPGEGWHNLADNDPLMGPVVRQELQRQQQQIINCFGQNRQMAQIVMSVPDDSFIYYKADDNGQLQLRLTAWGYRKPVVIGGGMASGVTGVHRPTEQVSVSIVSNGVGVGDKTFLLNGFTRKTDAQGVYELGQLPIGYELDIDVDGLMRHVVITQGQQLIVIDVTPAEDASGDTVVVPPVIVDEGDVASAGEDTADGSGEGAVVPTGDTDTGVTPSDETDNGETKGETDNGETTDETDNGDSKAEEKKPSSMNLLLQLLLMLFGLAALVVGTWYCCKEILS